MRNGELAQRGGDASAPPRAPLRTESLAAGAGSYGQGTPRALSAGVYVHFPWCLAKCPYCDFVSYVGNGGESSRYADAVLRELGVRAPAFAGRRIESIFFGGGTPSLWDPTELERVLSSVRDLFAVGAGAEVTVECNPTSLDDRRAAALAAAGVNRLSIGVQSLRDERLRFLGRLHDARGAIAAVRAALGAGFERVSADLIFGLPGQSPADACAEATELADLGLDHLSCYQLTIEPGTRFGELARKGRLPLAEEGAVADAFVAIDGTLGARGFTHYEVSNYARPGQEARHNLGYWRGDEYLGLGCGAVGFVRHAAYPRDGACARPSAHGTRWRNVAEPMRYMRMAEAAAAEQAPGSVDLGGAPSPYDASPGSRETLDAETLMRERIMLGLRLREGIDIDAAARDLGVEGWTASRERAASVLEGRGRIAREGPRVRIPCGAWLWTDDTSSRLF